MCIIIAADRNKEITKEVLKNCWEANSDGAGYMFSVNNELHVKKGFMKFEDFINSWETVPTYTPRVVHFRISTHGKTNEENTHPFFVSHRLGFVHNGVINGVSNSKKEFSDTWHFKEEFLKPMYRQDGKFLEKKFNTSLISSFIGGSKLVFLNNKGQMTFINKEKGVEKNGIWYSNYSFEFKQQKPIKIKNYTQTQQLPYKEDNSWWFEGDYALIKYDMPQKQLKKGEMVYINNVFGKQIEILIHFQENQHVIERKLWVHEQDLTDLEYNYGGF